MADEFCEADYLFSEHRRLLNIASTESKKRKKAEYCTKAIKEDLTRMEEEVAKREKGLYRMQAYFETQMERMRGFLDEQDRIIGEQTEVAVNIMEIAKDHQNRFERLQQRVENENPTCCVCMVHAPGNMVNPCGTCVNGHICLACFCKWNRTSHTGTRIRCPTCNQAYPDDIQVTPERPAQQRVLLFEGTPVTQPVTQPASPIGEANVRESTRTFNDYGR